MSATHDPEEQVYFEARTPEYQAWMEATCTMNEKDRRMNVHICIPLEVYRECPLNSVYLFAGGVVVKVKWGWCYHIYLYLQEYPRILWRYQVCPNTSMSNPHVRVDCHHRSLDGFQHNTEGISPEPMSKITQLLLDVLTKQQPDLVLNNEAEVREYIMANHAVKYEVHPANHQEAAVRVVRE